MANLLKTFFCTQKTLANVSNRLWNSLSILVEALSLGGIQEVLMKMPTIPGLDVFPTIMTTNISFKEI